MTRTGPEGYATDRDGSLVYFVRETGGAGRVKIGITRSMRSRLATLQTGSPERLQVIHTEPGGRAREAYLHRRWARHRVRRDGEWFAPAPEILAYAANAPDGRAGRLALSLRDIPWRRFLPRRSRRRGYAVSTLAGIARRVTVGAVGLAVLYTAGHEFAPDTTAAVVAFLWHLD